MLDEIPVEFHPKYIDHVTNTEALCSNIQYLFCSKIHISNPFKLKFSENVEWVMLGMLERVKITFHKNLG